MDYIIDFQDLLGLKDESPEGAIITVYGELGDLHAR